MNRRRRNAARSRSRGAPDHAAVARRVLEVEISELRRVQRDLGRSFNRVVELLLGRLAQGGKMVWTGVGKNLPIAQKIAATLTSTGAPSVVMHPSDAMHGDLGVIQPMDAVIAMSYSGASDELLQLVPALRRLGPPIVAFTADERSPLARLCDAVLRVRVRREACPFNLAPTASTTAMLAVGDALAITLLQARGFGREDYAKLHPAGAIGRALLLRVRDIMRTGSRLATVDVTARVSDAVLAMTRARAGSVAVVDDRGRLAGIFTDGDLRRQMAAGIHPGERPISEVMTRDPVCVEADRLAVDVLRAFREHAIDDLVVVDREGRVVGMVDLQDLPRLKLL
ncbi:MAG: KpsF/GutQ family sugar-phosphate isomerase [Kiritimatiellae bacterium]|nr:KpsF/GutQ family sugar-phosphate isomerase [Kiritimatiellia bacterium]